MSEAAAESRTGPGRAIASEVLGAVALVFISAAWLCREFGRDVLSLDAADQKVLLALGLAYLANGVLLALREPRPLLARLVEGVVSVVAFIAGALALLELRHFELSRQTMALAIGGGLGLAALREGLRAGSTVHIVALLLLTVAGFAHSQRAGQGAQIE